MKLISGCGEATPTCPRILQDESGLYIVIGKALSLKEHANLDLDVGEKAVYIPPDVMIEAARKIMLQLAQAL